MPPPALPTASELKVASVDAGAGTLLTHEMLSKPIYVVLLLLAPALILTDFIYFPA